MIKYQIKEALDKIACDTAFHPNTSALTHICPNDIRLRCIDDNGEEAAFKYTNGQLFKWAEAVKAWLPVGILSIRRPAQRLHG
jgi:hypothetical protein